MQTLNNVSSPERQGVKTQYEPAEKKHANALLTPLPASLTRRQMKEADALSSSPPAGVYCGVPFHIIHPARL